ncbi:MAG: chaperone modulator CbpM [Granulosicoccaceae bacterium]
MDPTKIQNESVALKGVYFTLAELGANCQLRAEQVNEFVENGVITSDCSYANLYSTTQLARLRKACRLKATIGIEARSAATALNLLEHIERLEKRRSWMKFACIEHSSLTMQ